jgi:hypothetical protein
MKNDKLFKKYYEPKLVEQNIDNVVLRTYTHITGLSTDDPSNSTELVFSPRKDVDHKMDEIFAEVGEKKGMAITSIVSQKAQPKYLFLLDCTLSVSDQNEKSLLFALKKSLDTLPALKSGMVLRTKNSYHVIGFVPLSFNEWHRHMAQAILLRTEDGSHVGDIRYIGHSLERGYGSLRLSDYLGKPTPDFVCYL